MSSGISFSSTDTPPPLPIHRFTVDDYHRLGELGLLTPDDRVELLEGWIVKKMNRRPVHGFVVRWMNDWLQSNIRGGFLVQCQLPITTQRSEPEPDLAVIRGAHSDFRDRHPSGTDCRLLIEVADTALTKDRARATIYASAGVEEYWIINLIDRQLERMTEPVDTAYNNCLIYSIDDEVEIRIGEHTIRLQISQILAT